MSSRSWMSRASWDSALSSRSVRSVPTDDVRARLEEVRRVGHELVPDAGVTSSGAMPASTLAGRPLLADRRRAGG